MSKYNRKKIILVIVLVFIIAGLGFINFSGIEIPFFSWAEKGIYNIITPVIEAGNGFCNSVKDYWNGIRNVDELIQENKELKEEISKQKVQILLYEYYKNENNRLRELLNFKAQKAFESIGARLIGYSTNNWDNRIIIDRGSKDGIEEGMPVITYNGALVGRIEYVGAFSAQVLLCNASEFVVGGVVERPESRAIGLVKGQLDQPRINVMENISWNIRSEEGDITEGDLIVTSGLSNIYPRGIPIGKVISVEYDNYGLSQKAEIELYMNKKTMEEVLVITEF